MSAEGGSADRFRKALVSLLYARFPLLGVQTHEEDRLLRLVREAVQDPRLAGHPRTVLHWRSTSGLSDGRTPFPNTVDPIKALSSVAALPTPAVVVLLDLHHYLDRPVDEGRIRLVRTLRDLIQPLRSAPHPRTVVIAAPTVTLPADLEKDVHLLDLDPPSPAELRGVLDEILAANHIPPTPLASGLVAAAHGLTRQEAENAFARALGIKGGVDNETVALVTDEKRQAVQRTRVLEFVDASPQDTPIGGLGALTEWLDERRESWLGLGAEFGVRQPRGILITGVPGCGKSLTAKRTSVLWNLPLLRLDIGRVFAGLVGSSEANMREALRLAEALSPSILWIDEIEKGFAHSSGAHDSGVGSRVFGSFLTWMQEKTAFVFVIATANDISRLPPEFLRKGRFDEIFFVDLPTHLERAEILRIHLGRRLERPALRGEFPDDADTPERLAAMAEEFSGAEIEQAIDTAVFAAFRRRRPLRYEDVAGALATTKSLAAMRPDQVRAMRRWADEGSVLLATSREHLAGYSSNEHQQQPWRAGRVLG